MTDQLTQIKCGGIVANLEGRNNAALSDSVPSNTLLELNTRVRRLESTHAITLPPPSLEPTWDSLALRICRLKQKTDASNYSKRTIDSDFASMVPDTLEISIETLQVMCSDLTRAQPAPPLAWPKCDDDEMLDVIRQRLCHTAGRNRVVLKSIPISRLEIYAQLIGMTLKMEEETPRGMYGAMRPIPMKKSCCGCCLCYCHNQRPVGMGQPPVISHPGKSKSRFAWLKKLAFWRSADDGSMSSKTSSTIVDSVYP
ncbi:hypothetical protein B0J13DRAFT_641250 [Dactylonectria estremocensis]|uniref:Uncharacterized protein n=1 Tax=Dactylonectria estremocensis TaxID=1079267 RepID=A0A9P9EBW5_9HYPO|nr:hypothetical protein B0J13DRAFT_641250 [Dactylonectria estremocensis]